MTPSCDNNLDSYRQPLRRAADSRRMLDYERLDVYRCAIEHLAFVFKSIPSVPRGYSARVDQWRRAVMSIPLNIAEAVGKISDAAVKSQDMGDRFSLRSSAVPRVELGNDQGRARPVS